MASPNRLVMPWLDGPHNSNDAARQFVSTPLQASLLGE